MRPRVKSSGSQRVTTRSSEGRPGRVGQESRASGEVEAQRKQTQSLRHTPWKRAMLTGYDMVRTKTRETGAERKIVGRFSPPPRRFGLRRVGPLIVERKGGRGGSRGPSRRNRAPRRRVRSDWTWKGWFAPVRRHGGAQHDGCQRFRAAGRSKKKLLGDAGFPDDMLGHPKETASIFDRRGHCLSREGNARLLRVRVRRSNDGIDPRATKILPWDKLAGSWDR